MNEAKINTIIKNSMDWAFKIPDNPTNAFIANAFDGFGLYKGKAIYWEAKYLAKPMSFNFNKLANHQIDNLLKIYNLSLSQDNIIPLILIAVNFGRADVRIFYYKDMQEIYNRKLNKQSILKKEFENAKNFIKIKKSLINLEEVLK